MLRLISGPVNRCPGIDMNELTTEEREYEALATVRDVLLLLYSEISENAGEDCPYLRSAFDYVNGLTAEAYQRM
jgi:hypothetical protein